MMDNMIPIYSTLFPGTITGYGRLFITRLPKFIANNLSYFKHIDYFRTMIDSWLPSLDNMFNEYKYKTMSSDVLKQIKPEDIHFPEEIKRDVLKTKERGSLIRGLTSKFTMIDESEDLYNWLCKQDEATRALFMQPGPKWWEHGQKLQEFDPLIIE